MLTLHRTLTAAALIAVFGAAGLIGASTTASADYRHRDRAAFRHRAHAMVAVVPARPVVVVRHRHHHHPIHHNGPAIILKVH